MAGQLDPRIEATETEKADYSTFSRSHTECVFN